MGKILTLDDINGQGVNPDQKGYVVGDIDYERIIDKYDEYIDKAHKQRKTWSKEQFHQLRARCKKDLFFLCAAILGYTDLDPKVHGRFCKWIKDNFPKYQYLLALLPRAHFKTTVKTIGHNIQCALPYTEEDAKYDTDESEVPYPANLGTNIRILIEHEVAEEAARFLFSIARHFTTNPLLMALFPECIPDKKRDMNNKWELRLPRTEYHGEPTFDTMGVGTRSQGRHYNLISFDDIYGEKARESATETEKIKEHVDSIFGFLNKPKIDKVFGVGTRYKFDDVWGHMINKFGPRIAVHKRSVEEINPKTGKKEIIFPDRISPELLEDIKKNKKVYYSEWLNDPEEIGEGFQKDWWRTFEWVDSVRIAVFDGNPSHPTIVNIRDCYIAFHIDPGELTGGFVITATDYWWRTFTLAAIPIEFSSAALVELIFNQATKWHPSLVSVEADAAQHLLGDWVKSEMARRQVYFMIHEYYTKRQAKAKRIDSLSQLYAAVQLFHNDKQTELKSEFDRFGKSTQEVHILDALAQLMDEGVRRRGSPPGTFGVIMNDTGSRWDESQIDPITGYSAIDLV